MLPYISLPYVLILKHPLEEFLHFILCRKGKNGYSSSRAIAAVSFFEITTVKEGDCVSETEE